LELPPFLASLLPDLQAMLDDPAQWVAMASAALAAVLVMVSAFVKTIIPLRWLAVGSNVGFMVYRLVHLQWLMFLLHPALLPVNLWRVLEMRRLTRRVRQTGDNSARSDLWLQPHMRRRRLARGRVLFKKGDLADRLYVLVEGHVELVESGLRIPEGRMFGEIAFFAPDRSPQRHGALRHPLHRAVDRRNHLPAVVFSEPGFRFRGGQADRRPAERRCATLAAADRPCPCGAARCAACRAACRARAAGDGHPGGPATATRFRRALSHRTRTFRKSNSTTMTGKLRGAPRQAKDTPDRRAQRRNPC